MKHICYLMVLLSVFSFCSRWRKNCRPSGGKNSTKKFTPFGRKICLRTSPFERQFCILWYYNVIDGDRGARSANFFAVLWSFKKFSRFRNNLSDHIRANSFSMLELFLHFKRTSQFSPNVETIFTTLRMFSTLRIQSYLPGWRNKIYSTPEGEKKHWCNSYVMSSDGQIVILIRCAELLCHTFGE